MNSNTHSVPPTNILHSIYIGAFSLHQSRGWLLLSLWTEGPHGVRIRPGHVRVLYDDPWTHQSSRFLHQPPLPYLHVSTIFPSSNKTLTSKPKITSHCHNEDICLSNNVSTINCIGVNEESAKVACRKGIRLWEFEEWQKHWQWPDPGPGRSAARDGAGIRGEGSRVEQLHYQVITAWITVWTKCDKSRLRECFFLPLWNDPEILTPLPGNEKFLAKVLVEFLCNRKWSRPWWYNFRFLCKPS